MKQVKLLILMTYLLSCKHLPAQQTIDFNGNLETINPATRLPTGWNFKRISSKDYDYELDSMVKEQGKYAVSIASRNATENYGFIGINIPYKFKGNKIELHGYIKTENVNNGFAGFWLHIGGTQISDNMQKQNVHGTTDWKEYSIKLPYDSENGTSIAAGVLLVGNGKIWFDHVQLLIDGTPIENAVLKTSVITKAEQDTAFNKSSGIKTIKLRALQLKNLTILGKVWGFMKYHHPEVAKGNVNMDAELFRVMPAVIKAKNNQELSTILEQWIDKFGTIRADDNSRSERIDKLKGAPRLADGPDAWGLSQALTDKLIAISKSNNSENYYVYTVQNVGNPVFNHEKAYKFMQYPDAGYRLLTLYRYWNIIQYFSPYKHLIGEDWNTVLQEFIPRFVNDTDNTAYTLTTLALISSVNDTHANIWGYRKELEDYRGKFSPTFEAKFIENKLVVTGFYNDTLNVKKKFKIGDVINSINGVNVNEMVEKFLPITAASNYSTKLRDMPNNYLLRSNDKNFNFVIARDGKTLNARITGLDRKSIHYTSDSEPKPGTPGEYLITKQIGYLYAAKYHNTDLYYIKKIFSNTQGIIIDMRCYPSEFMPFTFVPYIKRGNAPFVKFSVGSIKHPGSFTELAPLGINPTGEYKGKVVVIVNEQTQSQAEYTTMAFQSSPNVTVIGSTTAGADGNVSPIVLPGGISTMISGIGILYPDGTETQRKGVKIDIQIRPTIKGIKARIDEPIEIAKQLILNLKDSK